jgi:DNA-binding beta-propeller fold protein YncE
MSITRRIGHRLALPAAAASLAALAIGALDARMQTASLRTSTTYGSGPIALSMRGGSDAIVLQADGRTYELNVATGAIGQQTYRVPSGFQAVDAVAAVVNGQPVTCLSLNARSSKDARSFVLQLLPKGREAWTWLRVPGVYVGLALEPARGAVYVSNSTTNEVFGVAVGDQNARVGRIAAIPDAERLGAMAIALATRRLYVADMGAPQVFTIDLGTRAVRSVNLPGVGEVRGMAWHAQTKRLYIADSGSEALWVVDPNAPAPKAERVVTDRRLRDPAGVTVAPDGTIWVADESARAVFQISGTTRSIARMVRWAPPKS